MTVNEPIRTLFSDTLIPRHRPNCICSHILSLSLYLSLSRTTRYHLHCDFFFSLIQHLAQSDLGARLKSIFSFPRKADYSVLTWAFSFPFPFPFLVSMANWRLGKQKEVLMGPKISFPSLCRLEGVLWSFIRYPQLLLFVSGLLHSWTLSLLCQYLGDQAW
ncbi:hypothetical protein MPH_04914 [Macrophomina phaseolina MS6]|uniref:Uncharacterized protein n=1 Tax=Macrophomina phaseolina (strain MS6) TaxID=1126212 RepID=K2RSX8_MACPH|nr:hypothetical protein MPH_04914 [Macrophomina phaseolina MS6]